MARVVPFRGVRICNYLELGFTLVAHWGVAFLSDKIE